MQFLLPGKSVVSVRNSLSSQNEDCVDLRSNQSTRKYCINCRPSITSDETTSQSVDPRPLETKENRYFLTLDRSWLSKLRVSSTRTHEVLSDDRLNRFGELAILSALYNDQQLSLSLNDALYVKSLPYMKLSPYHTSTYEKRQCFTTQNHPQNWAWRWSLIA